MVIDQLKMPPCAMDSMNVMTVPISTTNMTGFLTCTRGSSLVIEPTRASFRISRSKRPRDSATPCGAGEAGVGASVAMTVI